MNYWTYMLECFKRGQLKCYYTGQTNNLRRRVTQHIKNVRQKRTETFTGRFDFVSLIWSEKHQTRDLACYAESRSSERCLVAVNVPWKCGITHQPMLWAKYRGLAGRRELVQSLLLNATTRQRRRNKYLSPLPGGLLAAVSL